MSLKILIVDDSETVRAVLCKALRLAELPIDACHEAGDGEQALALLEKEQVDLIFTDINMPVMNGLELIQRLSADGVLRSIPVIVVTTEASQQRVDYMKRSGVAAYVRKPFYPEQLRDIVNDVLGASHAH
jgi:two-component system chemotaxis response regulator CheY